MAKNILDLEIRHESIRVGVACLDDEVIWVNDGALEGLYTIDRTTYKVKSILNVFQLFKFEIFRISSIIKWKNNIIVVPFEVNKKWIIYNKLTNEIKYKKVLNYQSETSGLYVANEIAYLLPAVIDNPIFVIELETLECVSVIENWSENICIQDQKDVTIWPNSGIVVGRNIYFPIHSTKYIIKVSQNKAEQYKMEIPYGISSISFYNKFWILPMGGKYIYTAILDQNKCKEIRLKSSDQVISTSNFIRIVVTEKCIFMLPISKNDMRVYNKNGKELLKISLKRNKLKNIFSLRYVFSAPYWEYYIEKEKVCFLPGENKFLKIDLETLEYEHKDIFLPLNISNYGIGYWFRWNQLYGNVCLLQEKDTNPLNSYLRYIKLYEKIDKKRRRTYGEEIWKVIKNER